MIWTFLGGGRLEEKGMDFDWKEGSFLAFEVGLDHSIQ